MTENSAERLTRLLILVPWLAAHSGISKAEAAHHFGLTVAALESDLELITFTGPGLYGGELVDIAFDDETVTVYDHQGLNRPLELSGDEAAVLLVGLQALQQLPDVEQSLIARVTEKLAAYAGAAEGIDVQVSASPHAETIAHAIRDRRDVIITYIHPVRDDATTRRVTPQSVITRDGVDYLNGWCRSADAVRTFRLDRMTACEAGEESEPLPTGEAPTAVQQRALVECANGAVHLLEHVPATVIAGTERAYVEYGDERWLIGWIVSTGGLVRLLEPAPLASQVRSRATAGLKAYARLG